MSSQYTPRLEEVLEVISPLSTVFDGDTIFCLPNMKEKETAVLDTRVLGVELSLDLSVKPRRHSLFFTKGVESKKVSLGRYSFDIDVDSENFLEYLERDKTLGLVVKYGKSEGLGAILRRFLSPQEHRVTSVTLGAQFSDDSYFVREFKVTQNPEHLAYKLIFPDFYLSFVEPNLRNWFEITRNLADRKGIRLDLREGSLGD